MTPTDSSRWVPEFVTQADIGRMAGVTRAAVNNWVNRHDDFPESVGRLIQGPVWRGEDIVQWLEHRPPRVVTHVRVDGVIVPIVPTNNHHLPQGEQSNDD